MYKEETITKQNAAKIIIKNEFAKEENSFYLKKVKLDSEQNKNLYAYIAPTGLDIDGSGNLYIDDPVNKLIKVYNSDGKFV